MANVTALAPKKLGIFLAASATLLIIGGLYSWNRQASCTMKLSQGCISLEPAVTPQQQAKGLGGRKELPSNKGMLFVYEKPQKTCFWMKDTNFNLDIIWLDAHKKITKIEPNLSPSSYPQSFCSNDNTQYVVELTAGSAARNNLAISQQLHF